MDRAGASPDDLREANARADRAEENARAAEAETDRLRTLLNADGTAAAPGQRRDIVQRTRAALGENRTELAGAVEMLAQAPDAAATEKTREALTLTGAALASVDAALEAWVGASPATSHGTPLENAHEALDLARAAIDAARRANEPGAADGLTLASETVAAARAALTAQTVERLDELRDSLAEGSRALAEQTRLRQAAEAARREEEAAREEAEADAAGQTRLRQAAEAARKEAEADAAGQARLRQAAQTAREEAEAAAAERTRLQRAAEAARQEAERERDAARAEVAELTVTFGKDLRFGGLEGPNPVTSAQPVKVTLTPRRTGVTLSFGDDFAPTERWSSDAIDYSVENYGDPNPDRLDIASEAVRYAAGAGTVIAPNGAAATVEFPGRGAVFRGFYYNHENYRPARQGTYDGDANLLPSGSQALRENLRGHAVSSFQFDEEGGLTMKFGGLPPDEKPEGADDATGGSLIYGDLESYFAKGTYDCGSDGMQACDETVTNDLTVAFGDPARDPSGEPAYYWNIDVPNPKRKADGTPAAPGGVAGIYEMTLTNHIGDPADDDPADDADNMADDRYLRYAAFGLFRFIDGLLGNRRMGRMQTIHYGFDAFHADNPLPPPTEDSIAGTFTGRTAAWMLQANVFEHTARGHNGEVGGAVRMRGNVTLHACIGGGGCQTGDFTVPSGIAHADMTDANKITGAIHDLEYALDGGASGWSFRNSTEYLYAQNALAGDFLLDGVIDANGAFSGTVSPDTEYSDNDHTMRGDTHGYTKRDLETNDNFRMSRYWNAGEFEGAFYGPSADPGKPLEAAGSWWAPAVQAEIRNERIVGIVGSFGAAMAPPPSN